MKKIILTRRVQLIINSRDKEALQEHYDRIYEYQRQVCRAANMINTHLFLQDRMKDLVYLTTETKVKLADASRDEDGVLTTSHMNSIYRMLSAHFLKILPSSILSNLNQSVYRTYQSNRELFWKGEKSLPNFRKNIPIPFSSRDITLREEDDGKSFTFSLFKIPFKTYLGRDRSGLRQLLRRIAQGEIPLRQSAIQVKKNRIYLLASLETEKQEYGLDVSLIAEVSLSIEYPLVVKIGREEFRIGNKEEFLYRRLSIQAARRRLQVAASWNKGGRGRKKKLKSLESHNEKEKNYIESRLHLYSRKLIDQCIRAGAGTILLVNQSYKEELAKEDPLLLRNWSYYGLKSKIAYKASLANIVLMEE
ncbi:MAG: hypothetical protein LRY55_13000 [Leadbetterella sp.]|nr:hypothetical protein [Leadbetterella sp.]